MSRPNGEFEPAPLIRMRGIDKSYPGVQALSGVDLTLHAGEVLALTGENGSGKSSLAKILYGHQRPDSGTIEVDGQQVSFSSPADALAHGIVAISQELTLAPSLTVAENILLGRLPRRRGVIDWARARRDAREALSALDLDIDPTTPVDRLSIEEQQQVEVVRAVSASPRVIVLDEATSSLSEAATEKFFTVVRQLSESGVAVVMISHRFAELYAVASRATVLRDGRMVGDAPLPETPQDRLIAMMVGRDLDDLYRRRARAPGETALSVRDLSTRDGELEALSLEVRQGEILGVAGLVNSGKSTLALALAGGVPGTVGEVTLFGRPVDLTSPRTALACGIGYVTDDRKRSGLLRTRSVQDNLSLMWTSRITKLNVVQSRTERTMTETAMRDFRIVARSRRANVMTLSGGNQQKIMLGRVFALGLDVLVLNEPTRGIDVGAKSEIYGFMQDAAERGVAVVMVSSELPELLGVTDRIITLHLGRISGVFNSTAVDEETVAHAVLNPVPAAGHEARGTAHV